MANSIASGPKLEHYGKLQELRATARRRWPLWLVGGVTLANGIWSIASVLVVRFQDRPALSNWVLPFGLYHWSRSLSLLFGFILAYLSFQLLQGHQVAWGLALGGAVLAVAAHLGRGRLWYAALGPTLVVALLLVFRRRFTVRSEPRSMARGVALMAFSVLLALAYGTLGFWLLDKRDFGLQFSLADALIRTLREFSLVGNTDLVAHTRHARWFLQSLDLLGITALAFTVYSLFRPVAYRLRTLPQQRTLMKSLLEQYGGTSDDYFKLSPDKSYYFSPDQRCGIAYRTFGGVALALGDPAGAPDGIQDTTRAFLRSCADNGWTVSFLDVGPALLPMYRRLGLQPFKIGEEAVVHLDRLAGTVQRNKHLRYNRNKFEKEGFKLVLSPPPHEPALLAEAKEVSDEWLGIPGRREHGFAQGVFDEAYLNEFPLAVVRDPSGRVIAFANPIRSYRPGEATLDLMRHRSDAPNGTMDYLFISLMMAFKEQGYSTFSLGLAAGAHVGDQAGASAEERIVRQLAALLTRFFSSKGLYDFKAKFEPEWKERFLVYQGGPLGLVRTAIALERALD